MRRGDAMKWAIGAGLLVCALGLGGCKRRCETREDCAAGEACARGACAPAECSSASECAEGGCVEGLCAPCYDDAHCEPTQGCVADRCVERECATTADCAGEACFDGFCAPCSADDHCDGELVCSSTGACVEPECTVAADCADGRICVASLCVLCTDDVQCGGPNRACHHGECVDRECSEPDHCTGGTVCDMGLCLPCGPGVACPDLLACVGGVCQACTLDAECAAGRPCRDGRCLPTCVDNGDCGIDGVLGCRSRTQARPCSSDGFCGGRSGPWSTGSICDACGSASAGCPSGECDEDKLCICATNADCPDALVCTGGRCRGCTMDAQCGCGRYCAASECHDRCESDADCPGSSRCDTTTGRCALCLTDADCPDRQVCYEDGCSGPCSGELGGGCAPFVTCHANRRCGGCADCDLGPPDLPAVAPCP